MSGFWVGALATAVSAQEPMGPAVVTVCRSCELATAARAVVFVAVGAVISLVEVCTMRGVC